MLWDPIRYLETCPSSDGACAMVLANEARRRRVPRAAGVGARHGDAQRADDVRRPRPGEPAGGPGLRRRRLRARPASPIPRSEIDCAEIYVPFTWYEPMWMENLGFAAEGEGWKMTDDGRTALDGDLPINPSGGVLSSNPIGASGMIRFAEAAMQVRGQAGEHQVDGARSGARPRLRRRLAVLRHVDRRPRQAPDAATPNAFLVVRCPRPRWFSAPRTRRTAATSRGRAPRTPSRGRSRG